MKRKELKALFNEICSRVHPIRGIYQERSTEKERLINREFEKFQENSLQKFETKALEGIFLSSLDKLDSEESLGRWYKSITKYYPPEIIPDTVYIRLIAIATQKKYQSVQKLLENQAKRVINFS